MMRRSVVMKIKSKTYFTGAVLLLFFSVLIGLFAFYLSVFYGKTHISKSLGEMPDPIETGSLFFNALSEGEYEKCDDFLLDFSVKGMAENPDNEFGEIMQSMLIDSYKYEFTGEFSVRGKEADTTFKVKYLNLELLGRAMKEKVNLKAEEMNFKGEDIFSEEAAMTIALLVAEEFRENIDEYCVTKTIEINLYYDGKDWKILYSEALEKMILGME